MRRCLLLPFLLLMLLAVPAGAAHAADNGFVLTRADVPGFKAAASGAGAGRSALGGKLPPALRRAPVKGAAFSRGSKRLNVGVFTLGSAKAAGTALTQAGKGFKPVKGLGDGGRIRVRATKRSTQAVVLVRVGKALGAVSFTGPARSNGPTASAARANADLLVARLRRVLARTEYDRTLDGVRPDGSFSKETALRAFAISYGTPIPGVKLPKGNLGGPDEGTTAFAMIVRVYDQLTPAQKAAVDKALDARPADPALRARGAAPGARASEVLTPDPGIQAITDEFADQYAKRLPGVTRPTIIATRSDTPRSDTPALADAAPLDSNGNWSTTNFEFCRIRVYPLADSTIGKKKFSVIMAHEVFHCFEFSMNPEWYKRGNWVIEGAAVWAADSLIQAVKADGLGAYGTYLKTPEKPLFTRTYDADGFWDRTDEVMGTGKLFSLMPAVFAATTPDDAFTTARGNTFAFEDQWASGMFRLGGKSGPAWNQMRPEPVPFNDLPPPHAVFDDDVPLTSPAYAVGLFAASANKAKPLITITAGKGRVRAGTSQGDLGIVEGSRSFCLGGKCACPKGTTGKIPEHQKVPTQKLSLAITGASAAGEAEVAYHALSEFCNKPPKDGPGGSGGGFGDIATGPAETNGDPHLTSLDGLHFDFQAAGEFLLARSANKDLEVQARQVPVGKTKTVTVNTQVAMRIGGKRVTVGPGPTDDSAPVVRIDGAVDALPAGTTRAVGDGTLFRRSNEGGDVDVTWRDGSTVNVRPVGRFGVAATVKLAESRANKVRGLLGDFDGNPGDDLADRKGKRIAYTAKATKDWAGIVRFDVKEEFTGKFFDGLYDTVGKAWRISQGESLFDYGPGQSTKTFTDTSFPAKPQDPADIPDNRRADAERVCRDRGVTQPGPLEDCIVDVAATGNPLFAEEAFAAQQAASVDWVALKSGAGLSSPLSLAQTGDGLLHVGFGVRAADGTSSGLSLPLSPAGGEGAVERVGPSNPGRLFVAGDGSLHAAVAEVPGDGRPAGAYEYARGGDGSWSQVGALTTFGNSFLNAPDVLPVDGGALVASPMDGVARLFQTGGGKPAGDPGVAPTAGLPDCLATSPTLARDSASGEVWLAWAQTDCPQAGIFAQRVDPASGGLLGDAVAAPGAGTPSTALDERLALTGRPGQAGVFLAYPAGDGSGVRLWRVGTPTVTAVKRAASAPRGVRIAADGAGGGMWLAWSEDRRLQVQRIAAGGAPQGSPRPADLPPEVGLALSRDVQIAARGAGAEVLLGIRQGETAGQLYRATFAR